MTLKSPFLAALVALLPGIAWAQTTPVEGLRENRPQVHALTNARIVIAPERELANGTLVIRDGVIESVGPDVTAPADARVWDMTGRTLYAGFIDPYSSVGMRDELPQEEETERGATYWNPQVRAHIDAVSELSAGDDARPAGLRAQGFTVAMAVPRIGMFRGLTAAVSLGSGDVASRVIRPGIAQAVRLRSDRDLGWSYPVSSMGAIALIRQTLHDADWHARAHAAYERNPSGASRPESNAALRALAAAARGDQPLIFEAGSEEETLRVLGFREEFPIDVWVRGTGSEYRLLDQFRGLDTPLILPVDFPETPDVDEPEEALNLSLGELRHWYLAPENPGRLAEVGLQFALTTDGLEDAAAFLPNVRTAVDRGLSPTAALAAVTTTPARYLGLGATHGTLEAGKAADIVVATGDLFSTDATVETVWIDGDRFEVEAPAGEDPRGDWRVASIGEDRFEGTLTLEGSPDDLTGTFASAGSEIELGTARIGGESARLHVTLPGHVLGHEGPIRLSGNASRGALQGWGELPDGRRFSWTGERIGAAPGDAPGNVPGRTGEADGASSMATGLAGERLELLDVRPAMEYGRASIPDQPAQLLVRGATVWTMGPQGTLEGADLLVREGRVVQVGRNLEAPRGATIIEAAGKHVTPGLIDAHIHSGVTSVNESGSAIVPEVRIGDVLTIQNIWMYRQLAGGLTAAHVMHGSANPIGGQNQHVKMRWGALPDDIKIDGAPRTVKFALGENPKRRSERYPDTRMGTEQIIRDHFHAAREYERRWQEWEDGRQRGIPPRHDLRMEALVDILNGDILVQSHSYRQDEILMLMRLAEEFGFRIEAFHHGVEAYKVAPELAAHGAAAVVWSDWGAFKMEAYDNTTYNARVLMDAGVLTSLHSDNAQIASRMNWEAAKMLRTGLTAEQALALVTINTARVLGVDDRIGSLESGKDADFVLWSDHPLSTTTRAEQTWIDGRRYFDLEEDQRLRARTEQERAQLIQLILNER